jgi:hypothetical protein
MLFNDKPEPEMAQLSFGITRKRKKLPAQELNLSRKGVHIINDLEAIARAVPILRPSDVVTINPGEPVAQGAIAVIAPGTDLGESFLTWDGSRYQAHSSEGGHSDFAPSDERQFRLLAYMFKKFDHVSFERVCSGIGIPNLYEFLRDAGGIPEDPEVAKKVAAAADPSFVIIDQGVDPASRSRLCAATIDLFVSILAGEAGNLRAVLEDVQTVAPADSTVLILGASPFSERRRLTAKLRNFHGSQSTVVLSQNSLPDWPVPASPWGIMFGKRKVACTCACRAAWSKIYAPFYKAHPLRVSRKSQLRLSASRRREPFKAPVFIRFEVHTLSANFCSAKTLRRS